MRRSATAALSAGAPCRRPEELAVHVGVADAVPRHRHQQRVLVQFTWLGETLRLDAKEKRLQVAPTAEGISAVFSLNGEVTARETVNPQTDDAAALAKRWLTS